VLDKGDFPLEHRVFYTNVIWSASLFILLRSGREKFRRKAHGFEDPHQSLGRILSINWEELAIVRWKCQCWVLTQERFRVWLKHKLILCLELGLRMLASTTATTLFKTWPYKTKLRIFQRHKLGNFCNCCFYSVHDGGLDFCHIGFVWTCTWTQNNSYQSTGNLDLVYGLLLCDVKLVFEVPWLWGTLWVLCFVLCQFWECVLQGDEHPSCCNVSATADEMGKASAHRMNTFSRQSMCCHIYWISFVCKVN